MANPYTPQLPTGLDQSLVPTKVLAQSFFENIFLTDLQQFMGPSEASPIHLDFMNKGDGETLTYSLSKELDPYNFIDGPYAQVTGTGGPPQYYSDTITFNQSATPPVVEYGPNFMDLATPIDMTANIARQFQTAHRRNITYKILKAACVDLYPNQATQGPVAERVLYSYGTQPGGSVYAANITDGLTAMAGTTDPTECGSSVQAINTMRLMAVSGSTGATTVGAFETEKKINPVELEMENGFSSPVYMYWQDPGSFNTGLRLDTNFGSRYYGRGVIESGMQPSQLKGKFFRGAIEDVEIIDIPELQKFRIYVPGIGTFAHNLFVGAQAFKFIWGKMPWTDYQYFDLKRRREWALQDIRGQKVIQFQSLFRPGFFAECGIIHHFVKINDTP